MNRPLATCVLLLTLLASVVDARAHGGEDHGAPPPPPTSGDSSQRQASASTSSVELVARWPAAPAGQSIALRVLISDFDTNAPIEGAAVTLDLSEPPGTATAGAPPPTVTLNATASPGIYEANVTPRADGVHAASITVVAGELVDVVALSALRFGPADAAAEAAHDHDDGPPVATIVLSLALAFVIAATVIAWLVRRRRHAVSAGISAAVFVVVFGAAFGAAPTRAHGGEDHGEPATNAPTGPVSSNTVVLLKESQFLLGIRTVRAALAPVADRLEVPGVVTAPPERHAAIFASQQGRVVVEGGKGIPMLGTAVKKGQLLAVLEAALTVSERASFSVESSQAGSEVSASGARVAAAERNVARLQSLEGVVSQRDRDDAAVELKQAEAALQAAQGKQSAYGSTERSTRIELRAPIDGILADVDVSPGELVEPGRRAFLIVDGAELWVEAKLYEADLGRMTKGASANVGVDAYPGENFPGTLLAVGEVIDPATRTVKAIFRVENPNRRLKLGMFAHVQIGAGAAEDVLVVPDSAILDVDGRRLVFVHTAPELFQSREVALGRRDGNRVEVRGGVVAGDRVVVSGLLTLKNAPAAPAPAVPPATTTTTTQKHEH